MTPESMSPEEFWLGAAQWGSFINYSDPGYVMYTFNEKGLVQSEKHRADCITWLDVHCREAAALNEDPEADIEQIDALIAYLRAAPLAEAPS